MKLSKYVYSGPRSAASLRVDGEVLDVALVPGGTVELPPDHEYTQTLLVLKHISPAPATKSAKATEGGV
ncbi:hypothetical protein GHU20_13575 [Pseudomonas aeruginosa]|nr:hypothetical protein [Pseudomonas aeruginosa]